MRGVGDGAYVGHGPEVARGDDVHGRRVRCPGERRGHGLGGHAVGDALDGVLPEDHPCAALDRVPLAELRDTAWVGAADPHDPCDRVLAWAYAQQGFEPVHAMRTDDYAVVQGLVAAGTGVALVPRLALGAPRADLAVRPPAGPELAREISVVVLRSTAARSAQELVSALLEQAALITDRWAAED